MIPNNITGALISTFPNTVDTIETVKTDVTMLTVTSTNSSLVDADVWNAIADGVKAVECKLCGVAPTVSSVLSGSAAIIKFKDTSLSATALNILTLGTTSVVVPTNTTSVSVSMTVDIKAGYKLDIANLTAQLSMTTAASASYANGIKAIVQIVGTPTITSPTATINFTITPVCIKNTDTYYTPYVYAGTYGIKLIGGLISA